MANYLSRSNLDGSYASVADLEEISLPENTAHEFSLAKKVRWLKVASSRANTILGQRFETPLKVWSDTVVWAVCEIAVCGLMGVRGYDPEAKAEKTFATREKKALDWLNEAKEYEVTPDPTLQDVEPDMVGIMDSDKLRGWEPNPSSVSQLRQYGRGGFFTDR